MTKLCPRGKAAAKRKFKVYPSAYANAYASKICAGKIKDPSGVKRKDFKGPKPAALGTFIGPVVRGALGLGKKAIKKIAEKRAEKSFFKQLKKEGYESDPAKQTRKNKMSAIVGKARNQKKPELYDKSGAAVGPTYVGSAILAVKGKEFSDKISEDIAKAKRYKKPTTATFMRKSKKYQQKTANFAEGGFNKVGMHDVMGSPISVDVDDDNLTNSSATAYYKDLL